MVYRTQTQVSSVHLDTIVQQEPLIQQTTYVQLATFQTWLGQFKHLTAKRLNVPKDFTVWQAPT